MDRFSELMQRIFSLNVVICYSDKELDVYLSVLSPLSYTGVTNFLKTVWFGPPCTCIYKLHSAHCEQLH